MGTVSDGKRNDVAGSRLSSFEASARHSAAPLRQWRAGVKTPLVAALAVGLSFAGRGVADGVGVGFAHGQDANQYGVQVQFDRRAPLKEWSSSDLKLYGIIGVGEFQGRQDGMPRQTIHVLDTTGVLRWEHARVAGVRPFVDFGFGVGGLSEKTINGNRDFGGKFEFNELVQTGVRFGSRDQYEFNVRGQHFSNAGLFPPNDGMTYAGIGFTWYWN